MKKTYLYTTAVAVALTLAGCNNDDMMDSVPVGTTGNGEAIEFAGVIDDELEVLPEEGEGAGETTRSVISGGQFAKWHEGDKVAVSDGMLSYSYGAEGSEGTSSKFAVVEGGKEFTGDTESTFHAFYPAAAVKSWNGTKVTTMIYANQNYEENVDGGVFGAYMATKEGLKVVDGKVNFRFGLIASVIEVNLSTLGVTPASVSLKSNNGEIIAGQLIYDCAAKSARVANTDNTYSASNTQSDVITVSNITGSPSLVRFYLLPVQLSQGVTITVKDTDGNYYTKTASTSVGTAATDGMTSITNVAATVCKPYYKKYNFGAASTATRKNNWMATIPSNTRFCMLSIPGSHDAATKDCSYSAKVQSKTIAEQLAGGIRGFDFRPNYKGTSGITYENFYLSHSVTTNVLFKDAMDELVTFVTNNPTETIYLRLLKDDGPGSTDVSQEMRTLVREYLAEQYDAGKVISNIGNGKLLGEFRGKLVITSNNPYGTGVDGDANLEGTVFGGRLEWTENTTGMDATIYHTWSSWTGTAYVQDNYNDMEAAGKTPIVKAALNKSSAASDNVLYLNWLNVASSGTFENLSNDYVKNNATTINNDVAAYITSTLTGRTGIVMFDFCLDSSVNGDDLNTAIINQNMKYVYDKRTRISSAGSGSEAVGPDVKGDEAADGSTVYSKEHTFE